MSQPQLAGWPALDDVEVVHNQDPWPIRGTRAEKRAARSVALWFLISAISGLGVHRWSFLFWPYEYVPPGDPGNFVHSLYTPVVGGTLGLHPGAGHRRSCVRQEVFPDEVSVQQRHDGPSDEVARRTVVAQVVQAGKETGDRAGGR